MRKLVLLPLLLAACATTSTTTSSNDAEAYIRAAAPRFVSAFNAGNADALSAFYADNAMLMLPNAPVARGPAGVRAAFATMHGATLDFAPDQISSCGDVAYEVGHYTLTAGGNVDRGNYVAAWRRQADGSWKMIADSVVSTQPAMAH